MNHTTVQRQSSSIFVSQIIYPDVAVDAETYRTKPSGGPHEVSHADCRNSRDSRDRGSSSGGNIWTSIRTHAFLVGWNLESFRCTIACVVEVPVEAYADVCAALLSTYGSEEFRNIFAGCSKDRCTNNRPIVLGEFLPHIETGYLPPIARRSGGIWITLKLNADTQHEHPQLHSLYCLGCSYDTSCYMFQYDPVDTDRLVCVHIMAPAQKRQQEESGAVDSTDLDVIVAQINASHELCSYLNHFLYWLSNQKTAIRNGEPSPLPLISRSAHFGLINCRTIASGGSHHEYPCFFPVTAALCHALSWPALVWCLILRQLLYFFEYKYVLVTLGADIAHWLGLTGEGGFEGEGEGEGDSYASSSSSVGPGRRVAASPGQGISLRELSLTAAYLAERSSACIRLAECCRVFARTWNLPSEHRQTLWMQVFSLLVLIWIDFLVGIGCGYYILKHARRIVDLLHVTCSLVQSLCIVQSLEWFNHSPLGIKLNVTITSKVGAFLEVLIHGFSALVMSAQPYHLGLVRLVGCTGAIGFTFQLVMIVDLYRLLSVHIVFIHRALSYSHQLHLHCFGSLLLLFQGRKRNALRRRVDSCQCDQRQLLFAIVLFSMVVFLLPNFAVFFFLFAVLQLGSVTLQYLVYSLSMLVKEGPYYLAFKFVFEPALVSDGIQFEIHDPRQRKKKKKNDMMMMMDSCTAEQQMLAARCDDAEQRPHGGLDERRSRRSSSSSVMAGLGGGSGSSRRTHSSSLLALYLSRYEHSNPVHSDNKSPAVAAAAAGLLHDPTTATQRREAVIDHPTPSGSEVKGILKQSGSGKGLTGRASVSFSLRLNEAYHDHRSSESPTSRAEVRRISADYLDRTSISMGSSSSGAFRKSSQSPPDMNVRPTDMRTAYVRMTATRMTKTNLFRSYWQHLSYFLSEWRIFARLLKGMLYGRPALDIQLIHGASEVAMRKRQAEDAAIDRILRIVHAPRTAFSIASFRDMVSREASYIGEVCSDGAARAGSLHQRRIAKGLSRCMLLAVLLTLTVQLVLVAASGYVLFASCLSSQQLSPFHLVPVPVHAAQKTTHQPLLADTSSSPSSSDRRNDSSSATFLSTSLLVKTNTYY